MVDETVEGKIDKTVEMEPVGEPKKKKPVLLRLFFRVIVLFTYTGVCLVFFGLGYWGTVVGMERMAATDVIPLVITPTGTAAGGSRGGATEAVSPTPYEPEVDLLAFIPVMESAENVNITARNTQINYNVGVSLADVGDFYVDTLPSYGWEVKSTDIPSGDTGIGIITAENEDGATLRIRFTRGVGTNRVEVQIVVDGLEAP